MSQSLQILVVANIIQEALILVNHLRRHGYRPTFERVDTSEAIKTALDRKEWDVILVDDAQLPGFEALSIIGLLRETGCRTPIIVVSNRPNGRAEMQESLEAAIVSVMKAGACDYVSKGNLDRLGPAVEQALQGRAKPVTDSQLQAEITRHKWTKETLKQRERELSLLNQVGQVFVSTLDLDQVLATVLEEVRQLLGVVACSAWLIDPESGELVCRQVTDPQSKTVRGWRLAPGTGFVGWVAEHGKSLIIADTEMDDRHFKEIDRQTGLMLRSILSAPLRVKSGVIGVLQVVDATADRFTWLDLALLESLATTTAIAIENVRLYEQAHRDAETKAMLLREVNHRVKNNLAAIIGLLYAKQRRTKTTNQANYRAMLQDLVVRIQGLATVHSMLSATEWSSLLLSELATQVIHTALQVLSSDKRITVDVPPSPVRVMPKQANSLALIINELVTNTIKYALRERDTGDIVVRIRRQGETTGDGTPILFEFRDNGPGYPADILQLEHYNVGLYLVQTIVRKELYGKVKLANDQGAVTRIYFKTLRIER